MSDEVAFYDDFEDFIPDEDQKLPSEWTDKETTAVERLQAEFDRIAEIEDDDEAKAEAEKLHAVLDGSKE